MGILIRELNIVPGLFIEDRSNDCFIVSFSMVHKRTLGLFYLFINVNFLFTWVCHKKKKKLISYCKGSLNRDFLFFVKLESL